MTFYMFATNIPSKAHRGRMSSTEMTDEIADLLVIGGGINGAGIARDASGRGMRVILAEQGDLAQGTSSRSTKLVHGGLRYLEYYDFRLVREALIERERLINIAPHIIWPLRFVLPHRHDVRPAWLIRLGLFLYDHLGGRSRLPRSHGVRFRTSAFGSALKPGVARGFVYSDAWVEDSRFVVLNARDAAERGAAIHTRTRVVRATREGRLWVAESWRMSAPAPGARCVPAPWSTRLGPGLARCSTSAPV